MGATTSAQRDAKSPEDATADECGAEVKESQDGESVDEKQMQKNGQISISSLNGKTDEQTDFNGHAEDNALDEVGQTDAMPQKEESPETIEVLEDEAPPQVNGEQEESECIDAEKTASTEEKAIEEKPEANEVGFKKIFRFVGFKFTLKKDKNEKIEPVQLLTVKETEGSAAQAPLEEAKEEAVPEEVKPEDEKITEAPETEKESATEDAVEAEKETDTTTADVEAETVTDVTCAAEPEQTTVEQPAEEEVTTSEKEQEPEAPADSPASPPSQETQSPFKRFFTQGIFSNLRKKTSFKKTKEEDTVKEKPVGDDIKETEEKAEEAVAEEEKVEEKEEASEQVEAPSATEESKAEASTEEYPPAAEEQKEEKEAVKVQQEAASETEATPEPVVEATSSEVSEPHTAEVTDEAKPTDDTKTVEDTPGESAEEQQSPEKSTTDTATEAEIQSVQDKTKVQGSPLKKLFTGAGLKKLSSKKQKGKKEAESKLTESGEVVEQVQSSTESAEKPGSGASSPEESGEHVVDETSQAEANVEGEAEPVVSDNEKKKDGILPWASFKKLVTPKKRVKRPSESEDEAPGEKPKSATLSSTESAAVDDKTEEMKPKEEMKDEVKEESQAESKTETKPEKVEPSAEEPKKKIDTSVSWEALICVGSAKKRARKTSDSDDEETKVEEEVQQPVEEQSKTADSPLVSSQEADNEQLASSPEPDGELVSTWESFKRLVTQRKKPKAEDKSDEASGPEQTISDSEIPKEESSFSLRKLIPRRKKKSEAKQGQASSDVGSAEEDSDTPAVVPLSEYDNEQADKVAATTETEEGKPEVTPVTPGKPSPEDRSPSWISTTVQNVEDEAEGKQLSDIPEEGDTAATPKSTDNTIAEEIVDFTSEAVTALEPAEETDMVSAVSRITASPVTSGETTPVPGDGEVKQAETILQEAVETISLTSSAMAVTVTEEQKEVVAVSASPLQADSANKEEKVVLVVHEKTEATAICTGLDTSEIKDVKEESPLKAAVEPITAVGEAVTTEVAVEDPSLIAEEAGVAEDKVFEAEACEVQTEYKEQPQTPIENAIEETAQVESVEKAPEAETVNELQEATPVKVAVMSAVQQEPEILEELVVAENTPKVETEGPVERTVEESVCAQTAEITETAIAEDKKVQELNGIKESVANVELASVEGVTVALSEEITASIAEVSVAETTESKEDAIPVVAQTEETAVTEEIVCVGPTESQTETEVKVEIISTNVATLKTIAVVEETCKKAQQEVEPSQATHTKEVVAIQEQSTVIVQEVIQNVVQNITEMQVPEDKPMEEDESGAIEMKEQSKSVEVPAASEITEVEPSVDIPVQDEKPADEVPAQMEEPTIYTPAQEEQPEGDKISETDSRAEDEETRIVTEKSPTLVSEAIQISETVPVAITDEIKAEQEEVATLLVDTIQQDADVIKQEVELREAEKEVDEEKLVEKGTESGDGKSQVEENLKEVQDKIQQVPTETRSEAATTEESSEATHTATVVSKEQVQIIEEQVQDIQTETTMEINVRMINVVDADKAAVQDSETSIKDDDSKSQPEDKTQTMLEETQMNTSTQDMTSQEGSGDGACQKTDAVVSEVKTAAEESVNAIKEEAVTEEVGNEIEPVSTEITTVS